MDPTDPVSYFRNDYRGEDEMRREAGRHRDQYTSRELFGQSDYGTVADGGYDPTIDQLTPRYEGEWIDDMRTADPRIAGPQSAWGGRGGYTGSFSDVRNALRMLQDTASQQGLSPADQAMIDAQQRQLGQQSRAARDAQMQQAQARGMGSSGLAFMSGQAANEASANRSSDMRAQMMMGAQQRALQAMQSYGSLGSQFFAESGAQRAQSMNAIDAFNQRNTDYWRGVRGRDTERRNRTADSRSDAYQQRYENRYGRYQDDEARRMGIYDREREERRYRQEREDRRTQAMIDTGAGLVRSGVGG
jgi:hypothetical protein